MRILPTTKCSTQTLLFPRVKNREVVLSFNGGNISSDGGLILFERLDKNLRFTERFGNTLLPLEWREKGKIQHPILDMVRQRAFSLLAGNEDLNDHGELRKDPLLQTVVGKDSPLASPSTLCRFENKAASHSHLAELGCLFVEFFIESHPSPPETLILDFDATDFPIHGEQEKRFFHGYYDHHCYLPLYVFCGGQLLAAHLRPSKIDGAKHSWAILSLLVKRLRQEWPEVNIIFRGDSGFCRHKMFDWSEKHNVKYIVGIGANERIKKMTEAFRQEAEASYGETGEKVKLFREYEYGAKTWSRPRRVIVKAESNSQGANTRAIVTNLEEGGQFLYEEVYCARGEMENRIKEQQLDLFSGRVSCHDFEANEFRLLLSSLAYALMERFRALVLAGTQFAQATCGRIRLQLVKIGAVIRRNTRKVYMSLSSAYPHQELFRALAANIEARE